MANTIKLKRKSDADGAPTTGDLVAGELALNTFSGRVFLEKSDGGAAIVELIHDQGGQTIGGALTVGAFTSTGIDDNATGERLQLLDGALNIGASDTAVYPVTRVGTVGAISLTGGNALGVGGEFLAYGSTHASLAGDVQLRSSGNVLLDWDETAGQIVISTGVGAKTAALTIDSSQNATLAANADIGTEILFTERADHLFTPVATRGILWVRSDVPNVLVFTDDAGTDWDLNTAGAAGIGGSITDNQVAVGAATADDIEGASTFTWDATTLTVDSDAGTTVRIEAGASSDARILFYQTFSQRGLLAYDTSETAMSLSCVSGDVKLRPANTDILTLNSATGAQLHNGGLRFLERGANAHTAAATFGELWVRNDAPNVLVFTDDNDTDWVLNTGGGIGGSITDNQIAVGATAADDIEGSASLTYDVSTFTLGFGNGWELSGSNTTTATLTGGQASTVQLVVENNANVDLGSIIGRTTGTGQLGFADAGGANTYIAENDGDHIWSTDGATEIMRLSRNASGDGTLRITGGIRLTERADHTETFPTATFGEIWIKTATPNELYFTDDAGTDWLLNSAAGAGDVTKVGTPVDNQVAVWTGDGTIEGDTGFTYVKDNITSPMLTLTANASMTSGSLFQVVSNVSTKTNFLLNVRQEHASSSADCINCVNDGTGNGIEVSVGTATGSAARFYSITATRTQPLVEIINDSPTGAGVALYVQNDQSGAAIDVVGNIAVTGTVDGIDIATDVAANTLKVTNATHTGQVTGATALALDVTAVTAQPAAGAVIGADTLIINDGGVLSEVTATQLSTFMDVAAAAKYLLNTTDTLTGTLTVTGNVDATIVLADEVRTGAGNFLILNAGESHSFAVSQTAENVYINAEGGLQINSSPDNWASLWAGRNTANICASDGDSDFPGDIDPQVTNTQDIGASGLVWANVWATTFNGTATTAQYADLAENYAPDAVYGEGTVLMFGGTMEVTEATQGTTAIAGIVSTNPAFLMNEGLDGVSVALRGRVPCKVYGPISKGDLMIAGSGGVAVSDNNANPNAVLGRALANNEDGYAIIEVVVA